MHVLAGPDGGAAGDEEEGPIFRIVTRPLTSDGGAACEAKTFEGDTSSSVAMQALQHVLDEAHARGLLPRKILRSLSGPSFFGFSSHSLMLMLEALPDSDKLMAYEFSGVGARHTAARSREAVEVNEQTLRAVGGCEACLGKHRAHTCGAARRGR